MLSFPNSLSGTSPQSQNLPARLMQRQHTGTKVDQLQLKSLVVERNIINKEYCETIFNGHLHLLQCFERKDNLVVTYDATELKLWDWKSQKCLWTLPIEKTRQEKIKFILTHNRLVFSSTSESSSRGLYRNIIKIINLQNGTFIRTIEGFGKSFHKVCVIGKQIFGSIRCNKEIGVWDLDGNFIKKLQFFEFSDIAHFEKYLVMVSVQKHVIVIHDTILDKSRTIEPTNPAKRISHAYIYNGCLYCAQACVAGETNCDYFVIDIPRGTLVSQYVGNSGFCHIADPKNKNFTTTITANERWVVVANSAGKIYVSNQKNNKQAMLNRARENPEWIEKEEQFLLGKHEAAVDHLALEENGDLLVSGSGRTRDHSAKLKFWNLKKMEQIGKEISLNSIFQISILSELTELKLFIASHKSLRELDLLPHRVQEETIKIDDFISDDSDDESNLTTDEEAGYFSS